MWLGIKRFAATSMGKKVAFNWKLHVRLGMVVLITALAGAAGGMIMARSYWSVWVVPEGHAILGLIAVPFIIFGGITGWYMNSRKRPRKVLPLIHGLNNLVLLGLFVALVLSGLEWIGEISRGAIM
jgi:hypothetical protein